MKKNLPSKVCIVCNKPFSWRKKWERDWKNVLYCSKKCSKNGLKKNNNKIINNIDPDLIVSYGAALQGYILKNTEDVFSKSIALVDVLPLSIGVESDNGLMTKIIKKGSKVPTRNKSVFTNEKDNISELEISIYQGERSLVKDNILIDKLVLNNITKKEKGKNIIIIEMYVNNNCMLIYNKKLSVCPITTHLPLKFVAKNINKTSTFTSRYYLFCFNFISFKFIF